ESNIANLPASVVLGIPGMQDPGSGYRYRFGFGSGVRFDIGLVPASGRWWFVSDARANRVWPLWKKKAVVQDLLQLDGHGDLMSAIRIYDGDVAGALQWGDLRLNSIYFRLNEPKRIKFIIPGETGAD